MEPITAIEAVRRAIDPWGPVHAYTTALRPTATEVVDRLLAQGYDIVPHKAHSITIEGYQSILGGDEWNCVCGADGGDMYDLASHLNELFAQP